MNNIKVIGITGQSGSGKTTIANMIKSDYNIPIIIADFISRQTVGAGKPALLDIAKAFENVMTSDGNLNRSKVAEIIFSDENKKRQYEKIIFPYIISDIKALIDKYEIDGEKYVILDAPTLFESGSDKICHKIIGVIAPQKTRLQRIYKRDNITNDQAELRTKAQKPDEFYSRKVDYLINNNGNIIDVKKEVADIMFDIMIGTEYDD